MPENTGWSNGVSWFDSTYHPDTRCKTVEEAAKYNERFSTSPDIKCRIIKRTITEEVVSQ